MNQAHSEAFGTTPVAEFGDLEALFLAEYGNVARKIARIVRNPGRAKELAVEVFLRYSSKSRLQQLDAGMLYAAAVRLALDELRRETRRARLLALFHRPPAPEPAETGQERLSRVRHVLSRMKRRDSELLILRAEGMSYEELATALSIKPASVGTLLARAQNAFRKEYTKRYGNPE